MLQPDPTAIFAVTRRIADLKYPFLYNDVTFRFTSCQACSIVPELRGAEAAGNPNGHVPGNYLHRSCPFVNCNCSAYEKHVLGFDHDKVNTRNILPKLFSTGDNTTDHCIGVVWSKGGTTNLYSLLHDNYLPYTNQLSFSSSNKNLPVTPEGVLSFGKKEPKDMQPSISLIQTS